MAKATFVHEGKSVDYTPGADVSAGAVVVQEDLVGVVSVDTKANMLGSLTVAGVFDFPKATGASSGIAAGVKVYWDVAEAVAKADDETGANKYVGKVVKAAGDSDATVRVRLEQ